MSNFRRLLEKIITESEKPKGEAVDLDLTTIKPKDWKFVLAMADLDEKSTLITIGKVKWWMWKPKIDDGRDNTILTGNDPLNGKHAMGQRQNDIGYASYVSVYGKDKRQIVKEIKKLGNIKD